MTCIVGLIDNKTVYLAGDSAATTGVVYTITNKKVFKRGECVLGYSGSMREMNLLHYAFTLPEHPTDMDTDQYLATRFVDALRTLFKDAGIATKQNEQESMTGYFLVGYRGRLFQISSDYSVMEVASSYAAIGSGYEVALGSLHTTSEMFLSSYERIVLALTAASRFCPGVRAPFHTETLEYAQSPVEAIA